MRRVNRLAIALLTFLLGGSAWAQGQEKPGVAVMEFASNGGVTQQQMDSLADLLANHIRSLGRFRVMGKSDVRAVLSFQEQKARIGCDDDSCLAELGGALGVRWIVAGNISQFGNAYLLNLKLLDVKTVQVVQGLSKKITGGEEALIDTLEKSSQDLFAGLTETGTTEVAPEKPVAREQAPPPARSDLGVWGHVTTWTGVGLLVLGGVSTYLAWDAGQDWEDTGLESGARLDARATSRTWAGVMWAGYGAGAALVLTGVLLWTLGPEEPPLTTSAAPLADGTGFVLGIGGGF
ncbi:MAG TPA: CsgG/HfaB family protein [Myxococcota bacterium]|nr:CsgG/HfaB family protein [Myxococcota bacterium]HRY95356.1 CsgG/HfaB family protein [Myxococcota bacterium]HSA22216.1 CsgG/HfaB family protein [Myxococcota bacterium]